MLRVYLVRETQFIINKANIWTQVFEAQETGFLTSKQYWWKKREESPFG